jgi:hypothetical protein
MVCYYLNVHFQGKWINWFIPIVVRKSDFDPYYPTEPLKIKVLGLSKRSSASIFTVEQSMLKARRFVGTSGTIYTMTQLNISEDLKIQQQCYEKAKPSPNVTRTVFL